MNTVLNKMICLHNKQSVKRQNQLNDYYCKRQCRRRVWQITTITSINDIAKVKCIGSIIDSSQSSVIMAIMVNSSENSSEKVACQHRSS